MYEGLNGKGVLHYFSPSAILIWVKFALANMGLTAHCLSI